MRVPMWDEASGRVTAMGLRSFSMARTSDVCRAGRRRVQYDREEGAIYAQGAPRTRNSTGFELGPWLPVGGRRAEDA